MARSAALARARRRARRFTCCWRGFGPWCPSRSFSLSGSKLPAYILPSFPALAILIGAELERVWNGEADLWSRIALALTAIVALGIGHRDSAIYLWIEANPDGALAIGRCCPRMVVPSLGLATFVIVAARLTKKRRGVLGGTLVLTASCGDGARCWTIVRAGEFAKISKKGGRCRRRVAAPEPARTSFFIANKKNTRRFFTPKAASPFIIKSKTQRANRLSARARCCRPARFRRATKLMRSRPTN